MTYTSRRTLFKTSAAVLGCASLPRVQKLIANESTDPHFFLNIYFDGSLDSAYLFDARPLAFTSAGKIQNYLGKEPKLWEGANGATTLASELTDPLRRFKSNFSIINGIHMATSFDGHSQNQNAMFTGNPFGGESYIPILNQSARISSDGQRIADGLAPLDSLQLGGTLFGVELSNMGSSVSLTSGSAVSLTATARSSQGSSNADPIQNFLRNRMMQISSGSGMLAAGSAKMNLALGSAQKLNSRLASMTFRFAEDDSDLIRSLKVAHEYFKAGVTRSAFIQVDGLSLDTHDMEAASEQPKSYATVVSNIEAVFDYLQTTPISDTDQRPLLEVTTVLINSEFGRTNYQIGNSMDKTGTDHNPFNNMMLIGGKGIKGDQVIGASDLDSLDEGGNYRNVSPLHVTRDPEQIRRFGKPFDFEKFAVENRLPSDYVLDQHISIASIINMMYKMFNIDASKALKNARNGKNAPTLNGLLS